MYVFDIILGYHLILRFTDYYIIVSNPISFISETKLNVSISVILEGGFYHADSDRDASRAN